MLTRIAPLGLLASLCSLTPALVVAAQAAPASAANCSALAERMDHHWPDASTRILSAQWFGGGPLQFSPPGAGPSASVTVDAPAHCELLGIMQERIGAGGQHYAIRFHLRLPTPWNGRFYFQGGGGSNGVIGDALGVYSQVAPPALVQGFAVVSQDSGHDNRINDDPARGGVLVFGFDEQARANYGGASLPLVADAAKAAVKQFYGSAARHSYFVGCSKGGEEGMALAQRYPSQFDGIAASAPGMSLPRAAVAEAWDTQTLIALTKVPGSDTAPLARLPMAFSDADLALVRSAVLAACDADDGVVDGMVGDYVRCTGTKVHPQLEARRCTGAKADGCLSDAQIAALSRVIGGVHDSRGKTLYSDWPWDTGIASPGWRLWKLGSAGAGPPSLNVILGGASLASVFTTPPTPLSANPTALLEYLLAFDFDRDAQKIYATAPEFPRSAWQDISARSTDLAGFRARRSKLLVVQGVSDPVFSVNDTIAWWRDVNQHSGGRADRFVRLFPVPGMTHCGGGDATDQYDVLAPLMQWVEKGRAPSDIVAAAGPRTPWPKRTRPLCPYPAVARYDGSGDVERAASFACRP